MRGGEREKCTYRAYRELSGRSLMEAGSELATAARRARTAGLSAGSPASGAQAGGWNR